MTVRKNLRSIVAILTICALLLTSAGSVLAAPASQDALDSGQPSNLVQAMIDEGYLAVDGNRNISITEKYKNYVLSKVSKSDDTNIEVRVDQNTIEIVETSMVKGKAYTGVTKVTWGWIGPDLYLKSSHANNVVTGIGISSTIIGLIPPPLGQSVAFIVGGVGAIIKIKNSKGRGVIISFNAIAVPCLIGVRSQ